MLLGKFAKKKICKIGGLRRVCFGPLLLCGVLLEKREGKYLRALLQVDTQHTLGSCNIFFRKV